MSSEIYNVIVTRGWHIHIVIQYTPFGWIESNISHFLNMFIQYFLLDNYTQCIIIPPEKFYSFVQIFTSYVQ